MTQLESNLETVKLTISVLAILVVVLIFRGISNLLWHPLSSFPGPRFAALSTFYQSFYDIYYDGKFVARLHDLHKQYGPVVRVGPNELHFNSPEAYRSIYHSGSKFLKDESFYKTFNEPYSSFGTCDPLFHRKRRDSMNPLFSRRAILRLEGSIQERVNQLIQILESSTNNTVDLYSAFRSLTLDIIFNYTYGEEAAALAYPSFVHPILVNTEAIIRAGAITRHLPLFFLPRAIMLSLSSDGAGQTMKKYATLFIQRKTQATSAQCTDEKEVRNESIFGRIVDVESDVSWQSLVQEGDNVLFAGTDTVANACSVGCFYVHNDSGILQNLRDELRRVWPDPRMHVSYEVLEKLPYLTAVIKESLRISHGVSVGLLRKVQPGPTRIIGCEIPQGTIVSMGATFMHWNSNIFPDPLKFSPERWLQDQSRELDSYLVPFSRGPRQCIGINLAWCELYLIFGNLFRKIDLRIQDMSLKEMQDIRFHFVPVLAGGKHLKGVISGSLP